MSFVELLRNSDDLDILNGASDEEIAKAEMLLGVTFSNEYRDYLRAFGIASANGHEFTGICSSPRLNVVAVTQKVKKDSTFIPERSYVVEKTGIDGIIIWQESDGTVKMTKPRSEPEIIGYSLAEYYEE